MPPKRSVTSEDTMFTARELVDSGMSIRKAAERCSLSNETLGRYARKQKISTTEIRMQPNYGHIVIINKEQEKELLNYLVTCSLQFYGLTVTKLSKLRMKWLL